MKHLIAISLLLLSMAAYPQKKIDWKTITIRSALMMASGFCDGTSETLRVHYDEFENVFPNANADFWNPALSWPRKYKNGDPGQGEKFLFSTNALVWTTDGYHRMRMLRNVTMITAITIPLHGKKNWKVYVLEGVIYYMAYTGGFNLAYDVVFK